LPSCRRQQMRPRRSFSNVQKVLDDACTRVDAAKALLRKLDPEEQAKIQVNDTQLPELLDMEAVAQEQYETSRKRFETNKRYLDSMKEKAGSSS
jgi:hypothetical protein